MQLASSFLIYNMPMFAEGRAGTQKSDQDGGFGPQ
jgi:hypothetical protein